MAIIKKAKNMTINVKSNYSLTVAGKLTRISNKINIEAKTGKLILACNKQILGQGEK